MENKELHDEIDKMLARSGYEILVAKSFINEDFRKGYHHGAREMEEVWHAIIGELKQKILDLESADKTGRENA